MYGREPGVRIGFDCATIGRFSSASDIEAALALVFVDCVISRGICGLEDCALADP